MSFDSIGLNLKKQFATKAHLPDFVETLCSKKSDGKEIALFDADGTLWVDDVADDFTQYALDTDFINEKELWAEYLKRYPIDPPAACEFLLNLYRGMGLTEVQEAARNWWKAHSERNWIEEVMTSLFHLSDAGYRVWVVTASPTELIAPIQSFLPVDEVIGIDFEVDSQGTITGRAAGIVCAGAGKAKKVRSLAQAESIVFSAGNSMMDIPMIEIADPIRWAVYPNAEFEAQALERGWLLLKRPASFKEEAKFLSK